MRTKLIRFTRNLSVLLLTSGVFDSPILAQSPAVLEIQVSAGGAHLEITGAPSSSHQIQWTDSLSSTARWFHLTHCVVSNPASSVPLPAPLPANPRFYRSVWVPNTNLVWIPPGTATMGSPITEAGRDASQESQHLQSFPYGFWMGKYLVTQGEFLAVLGYNPSYCRNGVGGSTYGGGGSGAGTGDAITNELLHPVDSVPWHVATNYCRLLTQREQTAGRIPPNYAYRLPTDDEWEYACRAGTTTAFYFGDAIDSARANINGRYEYSAASGIIPNPSGVFLGRSTPVDSYPPNPWGLYDMAGNAFQWTSTRIRVLDVGDSAKLRGGPWDFDGSYPRSANRSSYYYINSSVGHRFGFRIVLAPVP